MNTVTGTYHKGMVVPDIPTDWKEGTRIVMQAIPARITYGLRDEDWPTDPEGIAALAASMDDFAPIEMTPEEEASLAAWRQKVKEYSIAKMQERIEGLFP